MVTFFLQKKKVTRAGARNSPSRARRRNTCSPPGRRNSPNPVEANTLTVAEASGRVSLRAGERRHSPFDRQCYPPHFMRECIPPNLHDPQRAKGFLDRRSKRLSFPHFFLRRKKCGRRRPPPRQGETNSPPQRRNPPRAKGPLDRRSKWFSLVPFFLQKKTTDAPNL